MELKALILLAFVAGSFAGPIPDSQCSKECVDSGNLNYEKGKSYTYNYRAITTSWVNGTSSESSGLDLNCNAEIQVISKCEMVLRLRHVELEEIVPRKDRVHPQNMDMFRRKLEDTPLRFSFQNGRISELCSESEEDTWALNIKRSVLSTFQTTYVPELFDSVSQPRTITETDITGTCQTSFEVEHKSGQTFIRKTKDLNSCSDRQTVQSAVQSTLLNKVPRTQTLVNSTMHCEQQINDRRVQSVTCKERHVAIPFSNQTSGAITKVRISMDLKDITESRVAGPMVNYRSDLKFQHTHKVDQHQSVHQLEKIMSEICQNIQNDIRPDTAAYFTRIVRTMRGVDLMALQSVFGRLTSNDFCGSRSETVRKFFLDAIPLVSTTPSVSFMKELIESHRLPEDMANSWISSLHFVQNPTKEMIGDIKTLAQKMPSQNTYLALSTLVHTYCEYEKQDCTTVPEVVGALRLFEGNLGWQCNANTPEEKKQILLSLKAIGNTGRLSSARSTLSRCFSEDSNPMDIRVAAIETFRRMSCSPTTTLDDMMRIFTDSSVDSELRIVSYLGAIRCPTHDMLRRIQMTMQREEINQVNSFVWSHLQNVEESSLPCKQYLRRMLKGMNLAAKFNMEDARKFSRNFEWSAYTDDYSLGGTLESNVVFSTKSYVPRSAMVNLTANVFGHSINLFEFGGRLEGMEYFLESFFGPNGYFPDNNALHLFQNSMGAGQPQQPESNKAKRSLIEKNQLDTLDSRVNMKTNNKPHGSVYMKMFGNTMRYQEFNSMDLIKPEKASMELMMIMKLMTKMAENQEVELTKNAMFLETSFVIPTMAGMPLSISINGSTSMNLKMGGKMDLRSFIGFPSARNLDITGYVKPSGVVEVASEMSVDAFVARTGLRTVSTLHSSVVLDGSVTLSSSEDFKVHLNVPRESQEIISVESKVFIVNTEFPTELQGVQENRRDINMCSGAWTENRFGIRVCSQFTYPNASQKIQAPFFPLTGPASFRVTLDKVDPSLTSFDMQIMCKQDRIRVNGVSQIVDKVLFVVGTPGTTIPRSYSVDTALNRMQKNLNITLVHPQKKVQIWGDFVNNTDMKRVSARIVVDQETEYSTSFQLDMVRGSTVDRYTPLLTVNLPMLLKPITAGGVIEVNKQLPKRTIDIQMSLKHLLTTHITFKGILTDDQSVVGNRMMNCDFSFEHPMLKSSLTAGVATDYWRTLNTTVQLTYTPITWSTQSFTFTNNFRNLSTEVHRAYKWEMANELTQFPQYQTEMEMSWESSDHEVEAMVVACLDKQMCTSGQNVISKLHMKNSTTSKVTGYSGNLAVDFPGQETINLNYEHTNTNKALACKLNIQGLTDRRTPIIVSLNLNNNTQLQGVNNHVNGSLQIDMPQRQILLQQTYSKKNNFNSWQHTSQSVIQWQRDSQLVFDIVYTNDYTFNNHQVEATITLPEKDTIKMDTTVQLNQEPIFEFLTNFKLTLPSQDAFVFDLNYKNNTDPTTTEHNLVVTLDTPMHLFQDLRLGVNLVNTSTMYSSELELRYAPSKQFTFKTTYENSTAPMMKHHTVTVEANMPNRDVLVNFFIHDVPQTESATKLEVTYHDKDSKETKMSVELGYNNNTDVTKCQHEFWNKWVMPGRTVDLGLILEYTTRHYMGQFNLEWEKGREVQVNVTYDNNSHSTETSHEASLEVKLPEYQWSVGFNHQNTSMSFIDNLEVMWGQELERIFFAENIYQRQFIKSDYGRVLRHEISTKVTSPLMTLQLTSNVETGPKVFILDLELTHDDESQMKFTTKLINSSSVSSCDYKAGFTLVSQLFPENDLEFNFKWENTSNIYTLDTDFSWQHDKKMEVSFDYKIPVNNMAESSREITFIMKNPLDVENPLRIIDLAINANHRYNINSGKLDYSGKFDLEWGRRSGDEKLVIEGTYSNETNSEMLNTMVVSLDIQQPVNLPLIPQTPSFQFVIKRKPMDFDAKFTYGWEEGKEMTSQVLYLNKLPIHDFKFIFTHPSLSHDVQLHSMNVFNKMVEHRRLFGTKNQIVYSNDKSKHVNLNFNLTVDSLPAKFNHSWELELVHLSNGVDFYSKSHVGNNTEKITYSSQVFFKNDGVDQKMNVFLQINKQHRSLLLQTSSPHLMSDVEINARFINQSTPMFPKYSIQINNTYDHQRKVRTNLCLDGEMRQVQAKCYWNPENPEDYLRLRARMVNESAVEAKLSHNYDGQHFVDALVSSRLNTSELLHSRIHWRPQSWTELSNQMKYALYRINQTMEKINRYSLDKCYKWNTWRKDIYITFKHENAQLFQEMERLQAIINVKLQELKNYQMPTSFQRENMDMEQLESLVEYFHSLNIDDFAKEHWSYWTSAMRSEWSQFRQAWHQFNQTEIQPFVQEMRENWRQINILASQDHEELRNYWQSVINERKVSWNEFQEEIESLLGHQQESWDRRIEVIRQRMQNIHQSNLENIEESNQMIKTHFESWNEEMKQKWQEFGHEFKGRWGKVTEYEKFALSQELERIREIPNAIYQEAKWAVKYWHVKERMQRMLSDVFFTGMRMLQRYTNKSLTTCYPTIIDPKHGEIQVECTLPFTLPSFTQVPDVTTQEWYNIFNPNYTLAQVYHAYKPSINPRNWIPPFPATAMLIGNQGFQTFDKTFYEFSGSCSYLLARDFVNDNFSVIVNYQHDASNNLRKSLTVISQGQEIEIGNDKSVVLNGQAYELPIQVSNITITRVGNLITMYNKLGLGITCDLQHNNCMVQISGWYFGKTGGMFGLYNNEQIDDQRTPFNEAPSSIEDLARSWEVSTQCSSHTNMAQKCQENSSTRKQFVAECQEAFYGSNEMKPCFAMVDPKPFIEMCINAKCSSSVNKNEGSQKALCSVISAYSMNCRQMEIELELPHQCVTCERPDGTTFLSNETLHLNSETILRSADIMVVVEEKTCNKLAATRLPALIKEINTELKSRDVTNNRFGLMGYGGSGVHTMEHSHTVSGNQLFGDANDFQAGVESLVFSETSTNNDTFRAIHAAANYPFRAGVAKTIILLTCSDCKQSQSQMYYSQISKLLLKSGITFNIIVDQEIVALNKKDQEIFGYDSKAVFTSKIRNYFGDKSLRDYIMTQSTMCTRLAQQTNGSVFDSSKMNQKAFGSVYAPRFAEHSTPCICQVCQCVANQFIMGQTVCHPCSQPIPATFEEPEHRPINGVYKPIFSQKTEKFDLSSSKKMR